MNRPRKKRPAPGGTGHGTDSKLEKLIEAQPAAKVKFLTDDALVEQAAFRDGVLAGLVKGSRERDVDMVALVSKGRGQVRAYILCAGDDPGWILAQGPWRLILKFLKGAGMKIADAEIERRADPCRN